jgi:hypothetical protein
MERTLIVGLGNPGKKYARTRHNVGTDAIEVLAKRLGVSLKLGRDRAQIAETRINGHAVVLAVPTTYMNDSGEAVGLEHQGRQFPVGGMIRVGAEIHTVAVPVGFEESDGGQALQLLLHGSKGKPGLPDDFPEMQFGSSKPKEQAEDLRLHPARDDYG